MASSVQPNRLLPARLEPTLLSTDAANKLHSVTYDAVKLGMENTPENAMHLAESRMKMVRYISHLETLLMIKQVQFYRFD
jgi:hypothetical protein